MDLQGFYSYFRIFESYSRPIRLKYPHVTIPNLPVSSTRTYVGNQSLYPSRIDYTNIHQYELIFYETRWLSSVEVNPDDRLIIVDNRNQHILLLSENGMHRINLTPVLFHQIQILDYDRTSDLTIHNS